MGQHRVDIGDSAVDPAFDLLGQACEQPVFLFQPGNPCKKNLALLIQRSDFGRVPCMTLLGFTERRERRLQPVERGGQPCLCLFQL